MVLGTFARPLGVLAASVLCIAALVAMPTAAQAAAKPFGSVAGQNLAQCRDHTLPSGDSVASDFFTLPVPYNLDGYVYTEAALDGWGLIYLTDETHGSNDHVGMVDVHGMDTDTRLGGSVTWGLSAAGELCAVWNGVADVDDTGKFDTVQTIITPRGDSPGRVLGDVDITFNFDSFQFGESYLQQSGYLPNTQGVPGVFLDNEGDPADYLDGGSRAFISHSLNSSQPGRYVLPVKNVPSTTSPGTLVTATPTISGSADVGSTLSADPGTWGPDPVSLSYQWARDGVAVPAAIGGSYVVGQEDRGHALTVTVTGSREFYTAASRTSAATTIPAPPVENPAVPITATGVTIAGTTSVGKSLRAKVVGLNPATAAVGYQWLRGGTPIAKATNATYKLTKADLKKTITVQVSLAQAGYLPLVLTSAKTATVAKAFAKTTKARISGTAKVGRTLTAGHGTWKPNPSFRYRWYADGKAIAKATTSTLKLTRSLAGKRITVSISAKKNGYTTTTKTSAATKKVRR